MEQQVKFLLVSNARSGSTWLQTSLARLPDISTDHEILFRKGYHGNGTPPLHVFVDAGWSASSVFSRRFTSGFGRRWRRTELASAIDPEIKIVQSSVHGSFGEIRFGFSQTGFGANGHAQSLEDSRTFLIKLFTNDLMLLELYLALKKHRSGKVS